MSVLLQVSDPHFGTECADPMRALVQLARAQGPDVVLLSGDLTQRARHAQFASARAFARSLAAPVTLAVPGNHDIPLFDVVRRMTRPYGNYARAFGSDLEPAHAAADLLVLCVNTTRPHRHKHGEVSTAQIERVAARLCAATAVQLRVVVVHHPVLVIRAEDDVNLLRGRDAAVRAWAAAGADLVLGGHIHLPYVRPLHDALPSLARRAWAVQAGTAVSHRVRDGIPNSVNLIRYDASTRPLACDVERWDYGQGSFAIVERTHVVLDR